MSEIKQPEHKCEKVNSKVKVRRKRGHIMDRICNTCKEVMEKNVAPCTFEGLIRKFLHKKTKGAETVGKYAVSYDNKSIYYEGKGRRADYGRDTLATKIPDGRIIGNASQLPRCGSYRRGSESPAQQVMFDLNVAMIPFNVFEEAGLDIATAKVIEKGDEEDVIAPKMEWNHWNKMLIPMSFKFSTVSEKEPKESKHIKILKKREVEYESYSHEEKVNVKYKRWEYTYIDMKKLEKRHFVGAMLLEVNKKRFLFDIDRKEIEHHRFNPFLVSLPKKSKTIEEAYESLKPRKVKEALKKGLKVERQGEWFFIPTDYQPKPLPKNIMAKINAVPDYGSYDISSSVYYSARNRDTDIIDIEKFKTTDKYKELKGKYQPELIKRIRAYNKDTEKHNTYLRKYNDFPYGANLQAGDNRPNRVGQMRVENGRTYVKGSVTHSGREHEEIKLTEWHIAVPNTAQKSWTITGAID